MTDGPNIAQLFLEKIILGEWIGNIVATRVRNMSAGIALYPAYKPLDRPSVYYGVGGAQQEKIRVHLRTNATLDELGAEHSTIDTLIKEADTIAAELDDFLTSLYEKLRTTGKLEDDEIKQMQVKLERCGERLERVVARENGEGSVDRR